VCGRERTVIIVEAEVCTSSSCAHLFFMLVTVHVLSTDDGRSVGLLP
jgi:hypothetical protein